MPKARPADPIDTALLKAAVGARAALASNLRALRAAAGLSQAQLAERAAMSTTYITALEGFGEQNPTLSAIAMLAHALGCTPDALVAPAAKPARRRPGRPKADESIALAANPRRPVLRKKR